jgi:7,8-dihydroneopterin aldolase/epimerase/oxygenase
MTTRQPPSATPERPPRRVFVRDLEVMASVGIFEVEHRYEQRIILSLELDVIDSYDGTSERIGDVLDYGRIVRETELLVQSRHFKLIETLAERVAQQCLDDARVLAVAVRVEKPDIIPACRSVGIEIKRARPMPHA